MPRIIALWTHPRSVSTAFERMMMARGDLTVIHEPFSLVYYTNNGHPDAPHMHTDSDQPRTYREARNLILSQAEDHTVFFKDMCYHCYDDLMGDDDFLTRLDNTFLIRQPAESLASHYKINPDLTRDEIGYEQEYRVFERVFQLTGRAPVVIDAGDLVNHPEGLADAYCRALDLPFVKEALTWEAGHQQEWNTWKEWHQDAAASTGIQKKKKKPAVDVTAVPKLKSFLDYHTPFYEALKTHCLRPRVGE